MQFGSPRFDYQTSQESSSASSVQAECLTLSLSPVSISLSLFVHKYMYIHRRIYTKVYKNLVHGYSCVWLMGGKMGSRWVVLHIYHYAMPYICFYIPESDSIPLNGWTWGKMDEDVGVNAGNKGKCEDESTNGGKVSAKR